MKTNSLLAPPDATHWSPKNGSFYTERDGRFYQWGSFGIAPVLTTHDWIAQLIPVDSAAPVWDGEGLPPVGVECEVTKGERVDWSTSDESLIGQNVTVKAIFRNALDQDIASIERGDGRCECILADLLKPVKTPEQLAAEQRERAIGEMKSALPSQVWDIAQLCGILHDAGYRKHDN